MLSSAEKWRNHTRQAQRDWSEAQAHAPPPPLLSYLPPPVRWGTGEKRQGGFLKPNFNACRGGSNKKCLDTHQMSQNFRKGNLNHLYIAGVNNGCSLNSPSPNFSLELGVSNDQALFQKWNQCMRNSSNFLCFGGFCNSPWILVLWRLTSVIHEPIHNPLHQKNASRVKIVFRHCFIIA